MGGGLMSDFLPWLAVFEQKKISYLKELVGATISEVEREFEEHKNSFDAGNVLKLVFVKY